MNDQQQPTEYYDVVLTDIQLHVQKMSSPAPLVRAIEKTIHAGKPRGRAYGKVDGADEKARTIHFTIPLEEKIQTGINEAMIQGKKIRFLVPKTGLPIYAGKDTLEKIEADNRKKNKRFDKLLRR